MKIDSMSKGDFAWWRFEDKAGYEYRLIKCSQSTDRRTKFAKTYCLCMSHKLEPCGGIYFELTHPALDGNSDVVSIGHVHQFLVPNQLIKTWSHGHFQTSSKIIARIDKVEYRQDLPWVNLSVLEGKVQDGDPLCGWLTDFTVMPT